MHWYNPKTRNVEDTPAPSTDEVALEMLRGDIRHKLRSLHHRVREASR
jgi:hypothetical protein